MGLLEGFTPKTELKRKTASFLAVLGASVPKDQLSHEKTRKYRKRDRWFFHLKDHKPFQARGLVGLLHLSQETPTTSEIVQETQGTGLAQRSKSQKGKESHLFPQSQLLV